MDSLTPESYASFPLTLFDKLFERTTFLTGWLVEGTIDADALSVALTSVTQKWRMLAGRLVSVQDHDGETEWRIRVPLGPIPSEYKTFALTVSTSEFPISHYLPLPLPVVSRSLPHSLFIHPSTPRQYAVWESTSHPLTCWHITHFPADPAHSGKTYTCLGFSRSHGMFDGVGAAVVANAVVSELNGHDWAVPPLPSSGFHPNPAQEILDAELQAHNEQGKADPENYHGFSNLGVTGAVKQLAWHLRERWWGGADRRVVLLSKDILSFLVNSTRVELTRASGQEHDEVSTGDILVAWVLKTVYSTGTSSKTIVQCNNLASFRSLLSTEADPSILQYPHNMFIPLPYPSMSVGEINKQPLHELSRILAVSRGSLAIPHVIASYKAVKSVTAFLVNPNAHETLIVSNVSSSRILESDWSAIGAIRTVCGYRYQLTPTELMLTNSVYIAGRLDDGSVVLDLGLNKDRVDLLTRAVSALRAAGQRIN